MNARQLAREPLVHFLLLGALLFVVFTAFGTGDGGAQRVVVTQADVDQLRTRWMMQWRRLPTRQELGSLIGDHIREEILYREAVGMNLDENDTVVRRRMVQKIEFLTEDLVAQGEIAESDLRRFYDENRDRYQADARLSFKHVYLSADRRGESAEQDAQAVLKRLRTLSDAAWQQMGDRFMLQSEYSDRRAGEIDQLFGGDFAGRLLSVATRSWEGPILSGYGFHVVFLNKRVDARLLQFSEVRENVEADFRSERRRQAGEEFYTRMRERYEVIIDAEIVGPVESGGRR